MISARNALEVIITRYAPVRTGNARITETGFRTWNGKMLGKEIS